MVECTTESASWTEREREVRIHQIIPGYKEQAGADLWNTHGIGAARHHGGSVSARFEQGLKRLPVATVVTRRNAGNVLSDENVWTNRRCDFPPNEKEVVSGVAQYPAVEKP
jgi:hypothetical protein